MDGLGIFDGTISSIFSEACSVVEEASSNGFLDGIVVPKITGQLNLCSVHKPKQLLSDVSYTLHHFDLHSQRYASGDEYQI